MAIGMCLIQLFSNCSVARIVFNNFVKDSLVSLSKVLFVTSILEIIFYFFLFYFHKKNYDSMNSILLIKTNNIKGKIKEKSLMLIKVSFILKIILYLIFTEAVEKPNYRIIRDLDKGKAIKEYYER